MKQSSLESPKTATTLCYQGVVPVEWEQLTLPVDSALRQRYEHDNTVLLQGLLVVDEQPPIEHEEELSAFGQELQRIDHKLNLILELLTQTLRSWRKLPAPVPVELSVERVSWRAEEILPAGKQVMVKLYLSPIFPNPFVVTGAVVSGQEEKDGAWVSIHIDSLGAQVQDALEKLVFRQHRRDVARARLRRQTGEEGGVS